jgi:hypothetical protein
MSLKDPHVKDLFPKVLLLGGCRPFKKRYKLGTGASHL